MPDMYLVGLVIILALCFDFINGFHDTANAIATCVATRALSPKIAIMMSAFLNFVGAMISTGVAKTIGGEIVTSPHMVDSVVLIAALASAIFWNLFTWRIGMPSSSSHALIGGVIGAVIISYGTGAIHLAGVLTIVIGLVCSPIVALGMGYFIMTLLYVFFRNVGKSRVNYISRHIQMASAALMAFSHGSNDAQKSMGIILLALIAANAVPADAGASAAHANSHPGQEFDYVLEGRMLVRIHGNELILEAGDCVYFDSNQGHSMQALDGQPARFLAMII